MSFARSAPECIWASCSGRRIERLTSRCSSSVMTPQSNFMVLAPVAADRVAGLRQGLASMKRSPGGGGPNNAVIPFAQFPTLHFARVLVLDDATLDDIKEYGLPRVEYPVYLALLADFDGSPEAFTADLIKQASEGLNRLFSYCEGFTAREDLRAWMQAHSVTPATAYVNSIGRTVRQVGEEAALHDALVNH